MKYLLHSAVTWESEWSLASLHSSVFENYLHKLLYSKNRDILSTHVLKHPNSSNKNRKSLLHNPYPTKNDIPTKKWKQLYIGASSDTHNNSVNINSNELEENTHFPCNICSNVFPSHMSLKKHKFSHYTGTTSLGTMAGWYKRRIGFHRQHTCDKSFTCEACDYQAYEKMLNLDFSPNPARHHEHMTSIDSDKQYVCETCHKRFSHSSSLSRHRLTHFESKRFTCETCGKSFTQGSSLKTHQFIHSGEKPFKCKECDKRFNSNSNLKAHLLTHADKPDQQ